MRKTIVLFALFLAGCGDTPPQPKPPPAKLTVKQEVTTEGFSGGLVRVTVDATVYAVSRQAALRRVAAEMEAQAKEFENEGKPVESEKAPVSAEKPPAKDIYAD